MGSERQIRSTSHVRRIPNARVVEPRRAVPRVEAIALQVRVRDPVWGTGGAKDQSGRSSDLLRSPRQRPAAFADAWLLIDLTDVEATGRAAVETLQTCVVGYA